MPVSCSFVWASAIFTLFWSLIVTPKPPKLGAIVFIAAVALSLVSCGRRGPLEAPPGASVFSAPLTGAPGAYEMPAHPGELSGQTAPAAAAAGPGSAKPTPARAPARPFVLDPLL
jgi:predicted small lipoprotein YifL